MKKANMSTETIVGIIMAIAVLLLSLMFIQSEFSKSHQLMEEQISQKFIEQSQDRIKEKLDSKNTFIAASSVVFDVDKGEKRRMYIGVKNLEQEDGLFKLSIENPDYPQTESWFKYIRTDRQILSGDTFFFLVDVNIAAETESINHLFEARVYQNDALKSREQLFVNVK